MNELGARLLLLCVIGCAFSGCKPEQEQQREKVKQAEVARANQAHEKVLMDFAQRHKALMGWEPSLPKRNGSLPGGPFSIDVSRALIASNSQPVLFDVRLADVAEQSGVVTAHFLLSVEEKDDLVPSFTVIKLAVTCSPEQVRELTKAGVLRGSRFAVVSKVEEVGQPKIEVNSDAADASDVTVGISVKGSCVDLLELNTIEAE